MSYRNAAEAIAQVAAQSQSDDTNATISKSPLVSGAAACRSEELDRDGFCWTLAQCTVGRVLLFTASCSCFDLSSRRDDYDEQVSIRFNHPRRQRTVKITVRSTHRWREPASNA